MTRFFFLAGFTGLMVTFASAAPTFSLYWYESVAPTVKVPVASLYEDATVHGGTSSSIDSIENNLSWYLQVNITTDNMNTPTGSSSATVQWDEEATAYCYNSQTNGTLSAYATCDLEYADSGFTGVGNHDDSEETPSSSFVQGSGFNAWIYSGGQWIGTNKFITSMPFDTYANYTASGGSNTGALAESTASIDEYGGSWFYSNSLMFSQTP